MYGEIARIGLITLASDASVLPEYQRLMPAGVQVYPSPMLLPRGEVTPQALTEMLATDALEQASARLSWTGVSWIVFACTTGSMVHGSDWDGQLVERIEAASGVRATTTAAAVLKMLHALKLQRIAIATPYEEALNRVERAFFEREGFEVTAIEGLGCHTDHEIGQLGPQDAIDLLAMVDSSEAEGLFVSCTDWHVVEAVEKMELRFRKPVITSNLAGARAALSSLGIGSDQTVPGLGQVRHFESIS